MENTDGLIKDFESLGILDRTYNDEMITNAMEAINIAGHFTIEISSKRDVTFSDENHNDGSITIDAGYEGSYTGEFDAESIWGDFVEEIRKEEYNHEDYNIDTEIDDLYTMEQIKAAFDIVSWEDHAEAIAGGDDVHEASEYSFTTSEVNESKIHIETTITVDVDKLTVEPGDVIDDLLNCL